MKVFFPYAYYYPEQCAGIYVVDDMMRALADAGIGSYLSVPTPTRNVAPNAQWSMTEKKCDGLVIVHRFRMYGEGKNPVFRALRYLLCEMAQLHFMLWKDYDVAFIDSTPPIQGLKIAIVRQFKKKPIIYNLQDIFPDSLAGTGLAKKDGLLWKIGRVVENITYRNADKIIVISQDFKKNIMAKGVPEEKIEVVYNWVDQNAIMPVKDEDNELFEEFGISRDKFRVVYAGNLGNAQNIGIIVEAAKRLKDNDNIEFVIFGTGGLEDEIKATKAKEQLDNLKILPLQPYERVAKVYGLGHVCIVACKAGLGGAAMPSKTWSIMSAGRAVLANFDEGELKEILENNGCGVFTMAGDLDGLVKAIETLSLQPEKCTEMGKNGRQFILDNITREVGTRKYVEVIRQMAGKS